MDGHVIFFQKNVYGIINSPKCICRTLLNILFEEVLYALEVELKWFRTGCGLKGFRTGCGGTMALNRAGSSTV